MLSGIYEVTKGKFKVIYPFHEHATVLDGEVTLTDEAGNSVKAQEVIQYISDKLNYDLFSPSSVGLK